VYGALEVAGQSGAQFLYCPTVNLHCSRRFLHQIAASDPAATHVVLWDGAGFHPKDQSRGQPANLRLLTFPSYSPELNLSRKALGPRQRSPLQSALCKFERAGSRSDRIVAAFLANA